jgi:broad specificity phosphatase PhoE
VPVQTSPPILYLVRHGQTAWSKSGQHTSRTDLALEPEGEANARALAPWITALDCVQVLSSPRRRAHETARLAGVGGVETTEDLAEWFYGDYEGLKTEDIRRERPSWTLFADGAPGGETAAEVGRRADRVIARALATDGNTLCFAHGHVLRVVAARWVELPVSEAARFALAAGSLSELGWERETRQVVHWNQVPRP